jgi:hypothetical protein
MADAYRQAQIAARARIGALAADSARQVQIALLELTGRMADELARLPAGTPAAQRLALQQSLRIIRTAYNELGVRIQDAIANNRMIAFADVHRIWREAGRTALSTAGVSGLAFGAVGTPPITILGAFENLGGAARHWKTALRGHLANAQDEANTIVRVALANGVPARELARRLRPYVQGAEDFHQAFVGDAFKKVRLADRQLPPHLRGAARRMRYNARRIAESEISNARAEAELQHYAQDPLIDGILWRTARSRGTTRTPDICDILEETRFFADRPPGYFPLNQVPLPPHPHDRCERRPFVRPIEEASRPKSNPMRVVPANKVPIDGVSAARAAALRRELGGLLAHTDRHDVQKALARLLRASQAEGQKLTLSRARVLKGLGSPGAALPAPAPPLPPVPTTPSPIVVAPKPLPPVDLQDKLVSLTATLEDLDGYTLRQAERAIATQPMEHAVVFRNGKPVFYKTVGLPDAVEFTEEELKQFRDTVFTHNHPRGSPPSLPDAIVALHWGIAEMRVATLRGGFSLKRGPKGFLKISVNELQSDYWALFHLLAPKLWQQVQMGILTEEMANHQLGNTIWSKLAPQYGWIYRRSKKASP